MITTQIDYIMSWFKKIFQSNKKETVQTPEELEQKEEPVIVEPSVAAPPSVEEPEPILEELVWENPMENYVGTVTDKVEPEVVEEVVKDIPKIEAHPKEQFLNDNIHKMYPQLKMGHVESVEATTRKIMVKGIEQEVALPKNSLMYGIDIKPDFSCCFALDLRNSYQLLTNGHLEESEYSKKEMLEIACKNFIDTYGEKIELHNTNYPGVSMLAIDGDSEASAFLINDLWTQIMDQMTYKRLQLVMPLQDTVLFWEEISKDTYNNLMIQMHKMSREEPQSRRVSNYLFEYLNGRFKPMKKVL